VNRRLFLVALATPLAAPLTAAAQQAPRAYRVGVLSPSAPGPMVSTIASTLRELGWVRGQNLELHTRFAESELERLPALAADLVELRCRCWRRY
jgi:putative ABC transport system substrate-binding protein